ncbi:hypothetical protein BBBOND_0307680 [Babesia bigemina]|uniref:Uncharacterized protein n=1 Tax=Babesia bigemina TaxID=5866 RepID=A0A061DCS8_BABBI|nr:hypothetical protein BBBOND_0307680 [Babesia bigemina]CDR96864.1 hypothetical protein BBBOND_0307680 [Babesia bigemina]|eukprot:XP_012769050.1 hypothetical protein BBBOND_0307680 [Babesia bigemina]
MRQRNRGTKYECEPSRCGKQCKYKEKNCKCDCCVKKCTEQADTCKAPPFPPPQPLGDSSGHQDHAVTQDNAARTEALTEDSNLQSSFGPSFSLPPETIAAVIVAIIVAIILLDLCIFRFPVGRNIRDFLVRKIPFCIAFYS